MRSHIYALREAIALEEATLQRNDGRAAVYGADGPASLKLIRALLAVVEAQANEIDALKHGAGTLSCGGEMAVSGGTLREE